MTPEIAIAVLAMLSPILFGVAFWIGVYVLGAILASGWNAIKERFSGYDD